MNSKELEQLMNNYSLEQSKEISLFEAYSQFVGEKKMNRVQPVHQSKSTRKVRPQIHFKYNTKKSRFPNLNFWRGKYVRKKRNNKI